MRYLSRLGLLFCLAAIIAGCDRLPLLTATPAQEPTPTSTIPPATPTETLPPTPGPIVLRVWVPPQFDPGADTRQGDLLRERLDEFVAMNPGMRVELRVKAVEGSGGLLTALTAAHTVAPRALPDLIALPQTALETAAIKGLLQPINELTPALLAEDWYDYARNLIHLETEDFGLPFAGDALILIYRPALVRDPPADLEAALQISEPLAFPAADPTALFPLTLYRAAGGALQDADGRPLLDIPQLTSTLNFFQSAERTGLIPVWLAQYDSQELALQAFIEQRAHLAITWTSDYLADPPADAAPGVLPTPDGIPYTLATGWVWAFSSTDPTRLEPSARLAEFLTEGEFLGRWTAAAGFLPTRSTALSTWPGSAFRTLVGQVVLSAQVVPPREVMTILGPALQRATVDVLKGQELPAAAAEAAVAELTGGP